MLWIRRLLVCLIGALCFGQQIATRSLAGSGSETATSVAVDSSGGVYMAGSTTSFDLPVVNAAQLANVATRLVYSPDAGVTWRPIPAFDPGQVDVYTRVVTAADPTNENVFYVAVGATVYKTSDRGAHFTSSTLKLPSTQSSITSIVVAPATPTTLYASATVNGGVFKSTDGGVTWTDASQGLPAPLFIDSVVLDPFHANTLWAWAGSGGYVSTDGGGSWTRSSLDVGGATLSGGLRFLFDGAKPGVIYGPALAGTNISIQRSDDGGQTWTLLNTSLSVSSAATDPSRAGTLYAFADSRFYRTDDFGATWRSFAFPSASASRIAVDPANPNVILAGRYRSADGGQTWTAITASRDLAVTFTPSGAALGTGDVTADGFLAKYRKGESAPAFATYFGGSGEEQIAAVKLDPAGNVWIAGSTSSADLPVTPGAMQSTLNGASDGFVAQFSADGALRYCTYIGGSGDDAIKGLAIDPWGELWVTGSTSGRDFPITTGTVPSAPSLTGSYVFAAKLTASATRIAFASYIGGSYYDVAGGIATDGTGDAIVTGTTYSADFPVSDGAYRAASPPANGSSPRAFVVKYSAAGSLVFSTYIGGSKAAVPPMGTGGDDNYQNGVAAVADGAGNVWITGNTGMTDFPTTADALQKSQAGGCGYPAVQIYTGMIGTLYRYYYDDVFAAKLSADGKSLLYSTLLGGSCYDRPSALAVGPDGTVWIAGETDSDQFPLAWPLEGAPARGNYLSFVSAIDPARGALRFSTYLSLGANPALAVGTDGAVWVAGATGSQAQTGSLIGSPFGFQTAPSDAFAGLISLPATAPRLNLTGVENAFSLLGGPVAPGEIVALTVPGFEPTSPVDLGFQNPAAASTTLGGAQVQFDGQAAKLLSAVSGRLVAIAPTELKPGAITSIQVMTAAGASNMIASPVAASNRGLLSADGSGSGAAMAWNSDGSRNSPDNPAAPGSSIVVLATGVDASTAVANTNFGAAPLAPVPGFAPGVYAVWITIPTNPYYSHTPTVTLNAGSGPGMGQWLTVYLR